MKAIMLNTKHLFTVLRFSINVKVNVAQLSTLLTLITLTGITQTQMREQMTLGGYFETVRDNYGKTYHVSDLAIKLDQQNYSIFVASAYTCQSGFFNIYFANGCGMAGTTTLDIARRATICELCLNVSSLLGWNGTWPSGGYVNLLVDDITNQTSSASTSSVLGLGTSIYACPFNPASPNPGIETNMMQRTIISKVDGWTNVVNPLNTIASSSGYYHGILSFNFVNQAYIWNSVHTTYTTGVMDLYSVALHELTHTLGFASLISGTGYSRFGINNNYYSTYDKYLLNSSGNPFITSTVSCNQQYGFVFTGGTLNLQPGCPLNYTPNITTCSLASTYNSANVPNVAVYTPGCFDGGGGTNSHFEDACYPTNNPTQNDQYFVLSNQTSITQSKRYLKDEERKVLCDLGYSVMTVYTSNAALASYTYLNTYSCAANPVWGINDGLLNSFYTFTSTGGPVSIPFTGTNGIVNNDASGITPTCIETVYNNGTVSVSGGIITFTPSANYSGPFLIRYIPTNTVTNVQGNITYIYGFIYPTGCNPVSVCDMVQNGGFETNSGCGLMTGTVNASCWTPFTASPDLFVRSCTTSTPSADLGNNTYNSTPAPFDSHSPLSGNDAVIGLGAELTFSGVAVSESAANFLSSPMINGQTYRLRFWAYQFSGVKVDPMVSNGTVSQSFNFLQIPVTLHFAGSSQYAPTSINNYPVTLLTNPAVNVTLASVYNTWKYYNIVFTYNGPSNANILYVGTDNAGTTGNFLAANNNNLTSSYLFYTLIDDVSIKPLNQSASFTLPNTQLCATQGFSDLSQYVSVPNGTFSGTGVSLSGTQYNFNVPANLPNGVYTILYTYVDAVGCTQKLYQQVTIGNTSNTATLSYVSASGCSNAGTLSVVSPTAGLSYTWQPANVNANSFTTTTNAITIYTATAIQTSVCNISGTVLVVPNIPTPTIIPSSNINCWGSTLTAIGNFTSVTWQPGSFTSNPIIVYPSSTTVYTAQVTNSLGCTGSQTYALNAVTPSTVTITNTSTSTCLGALSVLTVTQNLNFNNTLYVNWQPGGYTVNPVTVSPSVSTIYTANLSNAWGCLTSQTTQVIISSPLFSFSSNSICPGATTTITATGSFTSITWLPGNITTNTYTATVGSNIIYTVTATYSNGCVSTQTFELIPLDSDPSYYINSTQPYICAGNSETLTLIGSPGFTAVTWLPGNYTTNPVVATLTANTTFSLVVTSAIGCTYNVNQTYSVSQTCCSSTTIPEFTLSSLGTNTTLISPMRITTDFTVQTGVTLNLFPGEFIFTDNARIVVEPGAALRLFGCHLYACGPKLWKGILIKDGAYMEAFNHSGNDCLIEDAVTAIDAVNQTNTNLNPILLIENTVFNKNYVDVKISGLPVTTASYSTAFTFSNCVFTCRNLHFNSSAWPGVGTSAGGLRFAASSTAGLAPPYSLLNAPAVNLKIPYSSNKSHFAFDINNVGTSSSGTVAPVIMNGINLSPAGNADFHLFDAHEGYINALNSNLTINNSVFQNTQTFSVNNTPTVIAAIQHSNITSYNRMLDLSSTTTAKGNRFYDCHKGINCTSVFSFSIENASFRSTQSKTALTSSVFQAKGQQGIFINTNQAEYYTIKNNEFTNINNCVSIQFFPAPTIAPSMQYWPGSPTYTTPVYWYITYINKVAIHNNTISPLAGTSSSASTNNYVRRGISLSSPYPTYVAANCCASITVLDNKIYRTFNGISLNGINSITLTCRNFGTPKVIGTNTITLEPDNVWHATQRGIEFVNSNSNPVSLGQKIQSVEDNFVTMNGTAAMSNTNISLVYGFNNGGSGNLYPTPFMICNDVSNAYKGFEFVNWNEPTYWRGNRMQSLGRGMTLTNSGRIGQQGNSTNPSDNQWNGSWIGSNYGLWTFNSSASLSPLFTKTVSPYNPPNLSGSPPITSYQNGGINLATGAYTCGAGYNQVTVPLPSSGDYESEDELYIAYTSAYRYLFSNDSIKTAVSSLNDFYDDLEGSSIDLFRQTETALGSGAIDEAENILNSINTTSFNTVELNYYNFYTLLHDFNQNGNLSSESLTELISLAQLCPGSNGAVVYQARSLLQLLEVDTPISENCEAAGSKALPQQENIKTASLNAWNISLHPNPTDNRLNIISSRANEQLNIEIRDLSGRVVMSRNLNMSGNLAILDLGLINGAYVIYIKNQNNEKIIRKLLVAY